MSGFIMLDNSTSSNNLAVIEKDHILSQTTMLDDSGFESGGFTEWTNEDGASTNTIQSGTVHSGSYALKMESVYSSPSSWLPVKQDPAFSISLADNPTLSAAIYPLVTGITCGTYGQASIVIFLWDDVAEMTRRLIYVWSGYDFPGSDTSVNISRGYFKFYEWSTYSWHILTRDFLVDYTACYGTPSNTSEVTITHLYIYNHASNGMPGTFYMDDVQITIDGESTTTTTTTTTTITTTTTTTTTTTSTTTTTTTTTSSLPATTTPESIDIMTIALLGSGIGVIAVIAVFVVIARRRTTVGPSETPYNW